MSWSNSSRVTGIDATLDTGNGSRRELAAITAPAEASTGGVMASLPGVRCGSQRGDDLDLDAVIRVCKLRLDRCARGCLARRNPRLPDGVHRGEVGHARKVDRRRDDLRLVAARFREKPIDLRQHRLRLPGEIRLGVL